MRTLRPGTWRPLDWAVAVVFAALVVATAVTVWWAGKHILAIRRLTQGVGDTVFYTADGRPWFRMDEQRRDVPLPEISPWLQKAVVAVEDHRFYRHLGIDPVGVGRAVVENVRSDSVQGGSTITQQLARTIFLSNQRTWGRKAKEPVLALLLEQQLTKDQILELYLNRVYLSSGVYGVEPLSRRLFGKPGRDLDLAESALIAGLIRAPNALSPWSNLDGALARSRVVLLRMREERYVTEAQEREAGARRIRVRPYELRVDARGGYVKEWLLQETCLSMRNSLFCKQLKSRVILHVPVLDESTMAVAGIFAHADVSYDAEFRNPVLYCPDRLLHNPMRVICARADLILMLRNAEKNERRDAEGIDLFRMLTAMSTDS